MRHCLNKKMNVRVRDEILVRKFHVVFPNAKAALLNSKQTGFEISYNGFKV